MLQMNGNIPVSAVEHTNEGEVWFIIKSLIVEKSLVIHVLIVLYDAELNII